jgi:hypothetical protein
VRPSELLAHVADALEQLGVPYFVTGSVASMVYGEPRMTADVDIVARLTLSKIGDFCRAFPEDRFYVSLDAARDAIRNHAQFNIIDSTSGFKADIMIPGRGVLDEQRFLHSRQLRLEGSDRAVWVSSPEHLILKKLEFYREGESEKHLRDIAGIIKGRGDALDRTYIADWAAKLGVADLWTTIVKRTDQSSR